MTDLIKSYYVVIASYKDDVYYLNQDDDGEYGWCEIFDGAVKFKTVGSIPPITKKLHPEQYDEVRIALITVNAETVKHIETNSIEHTLQQALGALKRSKPIEWGFSAQNAHERAINAVEQALEQQESVQDQVIEQQPKQEPAAWIYYDAKGRPTLVRSNEAPYEDAVPLYRVPIQRKKIENKESE